jgi:large subunit ribosomal protein L22
MYISRKNPLNSVSVARSSIIKGSPQKVNLVLKLIRGKSVYVALQLLDKIRKNVALDIKKVVLSVISNAEQSGFYEVDSLIVKNISVGKSLKLKRFHPRARGRIFSVNKHYSRVYVELHKSFSEK